MAKIQTIKIEYENKRGFKIINKCDFEKDKHKVFQAGLIELIQTRQKTVESLKAEEAKAICAKLQLPYENIGTAKQLIKEKLC